MARSGNKFWLKIKAGFHRNLGVQNARLLLGLVLGLVLVFLMTDLNARLSELNRLTRRQNEISTEVANLESTRAALETQVAYSASDAAVADWARTEGHMLHEGDYVVVPISPNDAPPPVVAAPPVAVSTPETWEVWHALFFGE